MTHRVCTLPPDGWWCSRAALHRGPCAARQSVIMHEGVRYVPEHMSVLDLEPSLISLGHFEQLVLLEMDEERWTPIRNIATDTGMSQSKVRVAQQKMARMGLAHLDFLMSDCGEGSELRGRGYLLTGRGVELKNEAQEIMMRRNAAEVAVVNRKSKPKITEAVIILLGEGEKNSKTIADVINTDPRFKDLTDFWGKPLWGDQVYAAMSSLRSKRSKKLNFIEPVYGDVGAFKPYRLTKTGRSLLKELTK